MKNFNFIAILLFGLISLSNAQTDMRATIVSNELTAEIYVQATSAVSFPNPNNLIASNYSLSLPANGSNNPAEAPSATASSVIAGLAVTAIDVEIINGRFVYTFLALGTTPAASMWPANSENHVLNVTFSEEASGAFPRLDNHLISGGGGGQGYFYWEVNSVQRSDTEGDPFYGGTEGSYPNGDVYVEAAVALPVTLAQFKVEKFNTSSSRLFWQTSNETNTSHFEIERSTDARNWRMIGLVDAAGYSSDLRTYGFVDQNVYNGRDKALTVYYRLKMVDLDDYFRYSPIETVGFNNDLAVTTPFLAYPNPAKEGVTIEWDASALGQPTTIEVFDVAGKLAHVQEVAPNSNKEYIDFVEARLSTGLCMVRLMSGDEVLDVKQIIIGQN